MVIFIVCTVFHSFRREHKLKSNDQVCKNEDFCEVSMTSEKDKILHNLDKHNLYRGKDCMKNFCESSREYAKSIIDFEKKKCYRT